MVSDLQELCDLRSMRLHPLYESTRGELSIHLMGKLRLIVTEDEREQLVTIRESCAISGRCVFTP